MSQVEDPRKAMKKAGKVLILLGLVGPAGLHTLAKSMPHEGLRGVALIGTDVLRLCFFIGVLAFCIGHVVGSTWGAPPQASLLWLIVLSN